MCSKCLSAAQTQAVDVDSSSPLAVDVSFQFVDLKFLNKDKATDF